MTVKIKIPTQCPSCSSDLELVNSQLFCRNKDCPAQSFKKVEAFVKKMRIKGLGPASISKLGFVHPLEIYETHRDTFVEVLGDKIGQKIFDEIQNSRTTTFSTFLSALSIPLIGDTASKKIATVAVNIGDLLDNIDELPIGEKAVDNICHWAEEGAWAAGRLSTYLTFTVPLVKELKEDLGNVCITGKLNDFSNRAKAKEFLEERGYTVTTSITGKTDYLVDEEGRISSKSKKAESLGIPIVTIANLIN